MTSSIATPLMAAAILFSLTGCSASQGKPPPPPGGGGGGSDVNESTFAGSGSHQIRGEVWVDNWFALWVNGDKLLEDSVPITTERSFNAESFTFSADAPYTFAFEFRDFMENETGLEYIGTGRQQMGDGGAIAQFTDMASGQTIAATDGNWRCLVVQHAPVDASCASASNPSAGSGACAQQVVSRPSGWQSPDFDDSGWQKATVHSAGEVGPKDGYNRIRWSGAAKLIWGSDLKKDNILLCRMTVGG